MTSRLTTRTDAQLFDLWRWCGTQRVKSGRNKGHVTIKAAKLGDEVLKEVTRRNIQAALPCE
jgi:hypothetical protein